ncbi:TPM domain-containing protein [Microbacterium sp. YY-01]|uniref:TPM domain-containing protein n=1 Tax=Microbacterium sp. YY-01 TaxID=3421634 RepID=UPI003D17C117
MTRALTLVHGIRLAVAAAVVLLLSLAAIPAAAIGPVTLSSGFITDTVNVLSATEKDSAEQRLNDLHSDGTMSLFVVLVDDFTDPGDAQEWADAVAADNGLGTHQYLLAIAVEGRNYYISAHSDGPVSYDRVGEVERSIAPLLSQGEWGEAIIATADGLAGSRAGATGSGSGEGGGAWGALLGLLVVGGIIIVVAIIMQKRRRPAQQKLTPHAGGPDGRFAHTSDEELEREAARALVAMDDHIVGSREDLGFAAAQFGDQATQRFSEVIAAAQEKVDEAFDYRQKLDDEIPDTDEQRRAWHIAIIELCEQADEILDENVAAFDELRKLEQGADEALQQLITQREKAEAVVAQAPHDLQRLHENYDQSALSTVADNAEQARSRLALADTEISRATTLLTKGKRAQAAFAIRTAEQAIAQGEQLSHAIGTLGRDLAITEQQAHDLIADITNDLALAASLPDTDGRLASVMSSTKAEVDRARAELASPLRRPQQTLETLTAVNTRIDDIVARVRTEQEQIARAEQQLAGTMAQAQAELATANDYIATRRGVLGPTARTRLSQAQASLQQATALQLSDPPSALAHAQRALNLAQQATISAQAEFGSVGGWSGQGMAGAGWGGQGMAGGWGAPRRQRRSGSVGGDILGGIIGGIIAGGMSSGRSSRRGSSRSSSSGWRSSGGRRSGGLGPSSFGGSRGRPGGGRF